ncbi:phosphatase PAP2 family protein [Mesorhizobium yinganensis]|uniref:phosphatase PAP2 family protein n=1 Tax=Mesorhizobium yinganensis TaxID=3157707 RepID=UPI0032B81673
MASDGKFEIFLRETAAYIRADAGIYFFIAVYALAGISLLHLLQAGERAAYGIYVGSGLFMFGLVMPTVVLVFDLCWSVVRFGRRRNLAFSRFLSPRRLAYLVSGLLLMQAMTIFFGTFTSIKNVLPLLHGGFPYDRLHADIDAALHGGVDPWRLIQVAWGSDTVRRLVEWNYHLGWSSICYGTLFFMVTSPRARRLRTRYLVGFMLVWIIVGNLLAGLFLSAGPAFYGLVTGDGQRFAEQLQFLAQGGETADGTAIYQKYLWLAYINGTAGLATGISAFPSVHVALIGLNAFFLYAFSRKLGMIAFAYVAFVELSSVYLAWHYAIDGYAAIAVAGLIFVAVKKWLPDPGRSATARPPSRPIASQALTAS